MTSDPVTNFALAAELIRDQFPMLRCKSVSWLGEGYDSIAFDVDGEWVFRFPKRREVEGQLRMEFRLLPELAKAAPLPVPSFQFWGAPTEAFSYHFAGYPLIRGTPASCVDPAAISATQLATVGRFLSWLHAIPMQRVARFELPTWSSGIALEECRAEAMADFDKVAKAAPHAPLEEWFAYLRDSTPRPCPNSELTLIHADFAAEHVLFDQTTASVTGVIDWSEAAVGDLALDLSGLVHWGGIAFLNAAAEGSAALKQRSRARYYAACRGVGDVVFGREQHRPEYVDGGIRALHLSVPNSPGAV